MMKKLMTTVLVLTSSSLWAQTWTIQSSQIHFKIPYTFGHHEGLSSSLQGEIKLKDKELQSANINLQVSTLKTGNPEMDCHLQEALSINYEKSTFPQKHVCVDDQLPSPERHYPLIELAISKIEFQGDAKGEATGVLSLHGVDKEIKLSFDLIKTDNQPTWQSHHEFKILLDDYGVVVKPFLFIKVKNEVNVKIDITWSQQS